MQRAHVHHLQPRAAGGDHAPQNLCTLCEAHHLLLHDGRIILDGAPGALRVTHADGRPNGAAPPPPPPVIAARAMTGRSRAG